MSATVAVYAFIGGWTILGWTHRAVQDPRTWIDALHINQPICLMPLVGLDDGHEIARCGRIRCIDVNLR